MERWSEECFLGPQSARKSLTLRAFAKRIGVDEKSVRKAIARGRLSESVGQNEKGQPVILDEARAIEEWGANAAKSTHPSKGGTSLAEAQRRVLLQRERGLKISNDQKRAKLVDATKAARTGFEAARVIRESVLSLPARLSGEFAAEMDPRRIFDRLDAELRLALGGAADAILKGAA